MVNNETRRQTVQVKHYLPREITMPEHVEDLGGLVLKFDSVKGSYYVQPPTENGDVELPESTPTQRNKVVYKLTLKDVWNIDEEKLTKREDRADKAVVKLAGTAHYNYAINISNTIKEKILDIREKQAGKKRGNPEAYMAGYRNHLETLRNCDNQLDYLEKLVVDVLSGRAGITETGVSAFDVSKGKGFRGENEPPAITAAGSWKFILAIVTFLGILSVVFFLIWQQQLKKARVSPELAFTDEDLRGPDVDRTKGGKTSLGGGETSLGRDDTKGPDDFTPSDDDTKSGII